MAEFGQETQLAGGTLTLEQPIKVNFWYIQNQDTAPLTLTFEEGTPFGSFSKLVLTEAAASGGAGGYVDSVAFPFFGNITLTSSIATAKFGSGATRNVPTNIYPYPGNQGPAGGTGGSP